MRQSVYIGIGLFLAFLLIGNPQPVHAQLGIAGGLNYESPNDIEIPGATATFDENIGYHLGLVLDLNFGSTAVRPGFFYRRVGAYQFPEEVFEDDEFALTAYEVPVDFRFNVVTRPQVQPYLLLGPMMTFPQGEGDFDEATEDISFSFNVGLGLSFELQEDGMRLQPEARYEFGATKFIQEEFEIGGQTFEPQDRPRFNPFSVRMHLIF